MPCSQPNHACTYASTNAALTHDKAESRAIAVQEELHKQSTLLLSQLNHLAPHSKGLLLERLLPAKRCGVENLFLFEQLRVHLVALSRRSLNVALKDILFGLQAFRFDKVGLECEESGRHIRALGQDI